MIRALFLFVMLAASPAAFSQDTNDDDADDKPAPERKKSKLLTGFYVGSYFANHYSAANYNGYGFDGNGNQNSFFNSLIYQKIHYEYGGGYGQTDQIAQALGVDQGQWHFTESDMATNMHYTPAILVGFNFKVPLKNPRSAIIANINGTKVGVNGNFTISTQLPAGINPAVNSNVKVFSIIGREQRLQFQLGYQHILGDDDKLNFFVEGGVMGTLAKLDRDWIYINTLSIDLNYYVNQTLYPSGPLPKKLVGFGLGGFGGLGLDIEANPKITVQLLYTLYGEKINFGANPKITLQNGIGMRAYYNF